MCHERKRGWHGSAGVWTIFLGFFLALRKIKQLLEMPWCSAWCSWRNPGCSMWISVIHTNGSPPVLPLEMKSSLWGADRMVCGGCQWRMPGLFWENILAERSICQNPSSVQGSADPLRILCWVQELWKVHSSWSPTSESLPKWWWPWRSVLISAKYLCDTRLCSSLMQRNPSSVAPVGNDKGPHL